MSRPPRPLVSIITPTWQRHDLLVETIKHVRQQDYPNIEHVIVSDGPDGRLMAYAAEDTTAWYSRDYPNFNPDAADYPVRWYFLGRNYSSLCPDSFGVAPLTLGMLVARGDYQLWWSDDDRALTTSHVSRLVSLLESRAVDFVYPKVRIWRNGNPDGPETQIIGTDPPRHGQITHFLYRAELIQRGMPKWRTHPIDIALVSEWMSRGARWAMLNEVTFEHRLDQ